MSFASVRAAVRSVVCAALLLLPATAHAEWGRAESTNFIAYSEGTADDLKKRVADLEKFGLVLQGLTGARRPKDVPVKITVYFVRSTNEVAESLPYPAYGVAGYYNTTMRGPFTVMPRIDSRPSAGARYRMAGLDAKTVLQHELTHHFMFQYFPGAYPHWYTEGFADYAGAIEIDDKNVVTVGAFLDNRGHILRTLSWVHLRELMNPTPGKSSFPSIAFYSQGWITVHYLNNSPEGKKMLADYLRRINAGDSFGDALKAFGDMNAFDREVRAYSRRSKIDAVATQYVSLDPGPIATRTLDPVEDALVTTQMSLSSGVAAAQAQAFARRVRTITRDHPDHAYAQRMLMEAERLAGNRAEAIAAADRWLVKHPNDPWANFMKGDLETIALQEAKSTDDAAWSAARARINLAMKAMPNEPRFARAFYESYSRRGVLPPAIAQNALSRALDLIPRERSLRHMVAADYEARDMIEDAIATIAPDAYGIADESEKDKRRRERAQEQYRTAEEEDDKETPREMLVRLLAKQQAAASAAPAKPAGQ